MYSDLKAIRGCPLTPNSSLAQPEKNVYVSSAEPHKELYSCSVKSCCQKVAICITCTDCQQQFCVRHRHHSDHDCVHLHQAPSRSAPRGRAVVPDQVKNSSIIQVNDTKCGRRGARNPQVAAKVALMRLKQQAAGNESIPQEERLYLNVHVSLDGRSDQLPVFVSKYWTIGKVLDSVTTVAKVRSDNHLLGAQKVRLCDVHSRQPWPLEQRLEKLILGKTPLDNSMEVLLIREGELVEENDILGQ
uniref:AN1-type zinc finger protein 1-like isoform X2 n=1 Tax=Myxine glutinosa TaxID=7769 RepID=UPI00358E4B1D